MNSRTPLYNPQIDNYAEAGVGAGSQCGYTSFSMCLSPINPETATDRYVQSLVHRMETRGETLRIYILNHMHQTEKGQRIGSFGDSYYWTAQFLNETGELKNQSTFIPGNCSLNEMQKYLDDGYVLNTSTMLASSGHYICVYGYEGNTLLCNDPAGDQRKGYFNNSGEGVRYSLDKMGQFFHPTWEPYFGGFRFTAIR